jgi:hypothetical protein
MTGTGSWCFSAALKLLLLSEMEVVADMVTGRLYDGVQQGDMGEDCPL